MIDALTPTTMIGVGLFAAFVAVVLLGYVVLAGMAQRRAIYRSLRAVTTSQLPAGSVRDQQLSVPVMRRLVLPTLNQVGSRVLGFTPPAIVKRLDQELLYAGSPAGWDGQRLLAAKWVTGAGLALAAAVFLPVLQFAVLQTIAAIPIAALIGYYLPEWLLRARSGRRQEAIQLALPDALDLLSITVEAGLGFDAALERVSREMGGPLGEELYRVVQEMRLGKGRGEALRDLSTRTTVEELKAFVMAMVQAEIFGISVARVLHVQAAELRMKRQQRAEETAAKLPVKIIFPLLFCIFPALFVVLLGPAAITIYRTFAGGF